MSKLKPILLLVLVFLAGVAVGVMGTRATVRRMIRAAIAHPDNVRVVVERRLDRRLGLDADQRQQLHEILLGTHEQLKGLRQEFRPQFALIITNAESKISAILTPEQQDKFEKLKEENPLIWGAGERKE